MKIVIERAILHGSRDDQCQLVATAYAAGHEFRVYAPPKATGDAAEWKEKMAVHEPDESVGEREVLNGLKHSVSNQVIEPLERRKLEADIWNPGAHPGATT